MYVQTERTATILLARDVDNSLNYVEAHLRALHIESRPDEEAADTNTEWMMSHTMAGRSDTSHRYRHQTLYRRCISENEVQRARPLRMSTHFARGRYSHRAS